MHCLSSLDPTAPGSILSVPMKVTADKTAIEVLIDTTVQQHAFGYGP